MVVSLECQVIVSAMENHKQIIDSKICDVKIIKNASYKLLVKMLVL